MRGKVLRLPKDHPTYSALLFSMKSMKDIKGRRGRPIINLFDTIISDLASHNLKLTTEKDLEETKNVAKDKEKWET